MMFCDACGEKCASVHVTQMVNDEVKNLHLCEDCAAASGLDLNSPTSLADIMFGVEGKKDADSLEFDKTCPFCQMHFSDFKKTSRLGCQGCYEAFEEELAPLIDGTQKTHQHVGKIPSRRAEKITAPDDLRWLRNALCAAVAAEDYEEAAVLRDRIHGCSKSEKIAGSDA